jgi:hypothetical protein
MANTVHGTGYLFWADYFCIDQEDHDERAEQARIMRDIYRSATAILAWLVLPHNQDMATGASIFVDIFRSCR